MLLSDNYRESIRWIYENTKFEYIMTCLIGLESEDQEIYHYIYKNKKRVDRATGDSIAFIYPVVKQLMSNTSHPVLLREEEASPFNTLREEDLYLLPEKIIDAIYDECSHIFNFDYSKLPGIVVISRYGDGFPQYYHIESVEEFNLYIDALAIMDTFSRDYHKYDLLFKSEIKEDLEQQLSMLLREERERFGDIDYDDTKSKTVSFLHKENVNVEYIEMLHTPHNLKKSLKEISSKYPLLREQEDFRLICREARSIQQLSSIKCRILNIEKRIEGAISKDDIALLQEKKKEIYQNCLQKLTRIVSEESISRRLLDEIGKRNNLFNLFRAIRDRSREPDVSIEIKQMVTRILASGREKTGYGIEFTVNGEDFPIHFGSKDQTMLYICTLLRKKLGEKLYLHEFFNNSKGLSENTKFKNGTTSKWLKAVYDTIFPNNNGRDYSYWIKKIKDGRGRPLNQGKSQSNKKIEESMQSQHSGIDYCCINTKEDEVGDSYYDIRILKEKITIPEDMQFLLDEFYDYLTT